MTSLTDRTIVRLARRQGGVVARKQLVELGIPYRQIASRVRSGKLIEVHPGVFAVGHDALSRGGRWHAALLLGGERSALSHRTAAIAWQLVDDDRTTQVDIVVPYAAAIPDGGRAVRVHRTRRMPPEEDVMLKSGFRVTTVPRTIVDSGDRGGRRALERICARSSRGIYDIRKLPDYLDRRPGRRADKVLRRIVAEMTVTLTRSDLETRFLRMCDKHRLPRPLVNQAVAGVEIDFHWPALMLAVETDGYAWHRTKADLENDNRKQNVVAEAGYRVLRYTHGRLVYHEPAVAAQVARAIAAPARIEAGV